MNICNTDSSKVKEIKALCVEWLQEQDKDYASQTHNKEGDHGSCLANAAHAWPHNWPHPLTTHVHGQFWKSGEVVKPCTRETCVPCSISARASDNAISLSRALPSGGDVRLTELLQCRIHEAVKLVDVFEWPCCQCAALTSNAEGRHTTCSQCVLTRCIM
jgi:hypothetical protein